MKLRIDTLGSVKSYIARNDSVVGSNQGVIFLGSMVDPELGRTWGAAMTDFYPFSDAFNEEEFFGYNPVLDSVMLELNINAVYGKGDVEQKFNVYALRDSLERDSVYWFNVPIGENVDRSKPLFSFTIKDKKATEIFYEKVTLTDEGKTFMQKILDTNSDIFEKPYPDFLKRFYGIYIEPDESNPEDAAIYEIYMRITSAGYYSNFCVCMHNYEKENPSKVDTTLNIPFLFDDYNFPLLSANNVKHTYTAQIESQISDPYSDASGAMKPAATTYVQSLDGLSTYIEFGDELLNEIKALKKIGSDEYSDLIINQARLYIPMADPTTDNKNSAPDRLGMYQTYGQTRLAIFMPYPYMTSIGLPTPIYDYDYFSENASYYEPNDRQGASAISYDGYIYRTPGYYKMDITSYISYLVHYDKTPQGIWLGPDINARSNNISGVALRGAESSGETSNPIKLVVTYTLVK
ncbi:DUF4270 domain-containing protein, partial [Alistipes sp. OttesenSCG-928-B03]|nr:DUF4270 domain-containing protein [Alistipes sp. OttesenSCG-928-B03]